MKKKISELKDITAAKEGKEGEINLKQEEERGVMVGGRHLQLVTVEIGQGARESRLSIAGRVFRLKNVRTARGTESPAPGTLLFLAQRSCTTLTLVRRSGLLVIQGEAFGSRMRAGVSEQELLQHLNTLASAAPGQEVSVRLSYGTATGDAPLQLDTFATITFEPVRVS